MTSRSVMTASCGTGRAVPQRVHLIEGGSFVGQDEGQRRHRGAGVAVIERVEEEDIEVGPRGA